jgi:asparagine synthase (glutamine-hydrolysing)
MCGIVGIVQREPGEPVCEARLRQMLGMIRHRGPDQFGIYLDQQAALGNARLSIIDLSHGQQPIANEDESLWIVFNGEIFNYPELRSELQARGHQFNTQTDTEVVLHAYEEFGADCLTRFNGQFAIAIWDSRKQELFLARDRLGVRPLFYTLAGGELTFASEIKAILADHRVPAQLDPVALDQVFTFWSPLSPRTAFCGIQELPPGHYLLAQAGRHIVRPYWRLSFPEECADQEPGSLDEVVEEFRSLLVDATRLRLRADVPVGAYLSGGLDSSTIAAIVCRLGIGKLGTFSIAFSDTQFDESGFQRQMARFLGTDHQVAYTTHADIGRVFPEVVWHIETPVMRTAAAPMFLLSKLVRSRNYKVVLTGEGADEFLAGYDIFKEAMIRRFWARRPESTWRPLLLRRVYPDVAGLSEISPSHLAAFFGGGLADADAPYFSHAIRWRNNRRTRRFFSDELRNAVESDLEATHSLPELPREFDKWHPLARAQHLEISIFLSQYLLSSQGDRPAMGHSIEGRFPFLDVRLVEFCNRLPPRYKLRGLTEKFLLREACRGWLPDEIRQRRKRPYRAPIHRSFFNPEAPEYVRELLGSQSIRAAGVFKPRAVAGLVARIEQGKPLGESDDMALAGIISTQLLHLRFIHDLHLTAPLSESEDVKVVDHRAQMAL